jgi:hypothetical protein
MVFRPSLPEAPMRNGTELTPATLDQLAGAAAALTARCLAGCESLPACAAATAHLRDIAKRVAERDTVLAATCEACAIEIESMMHTGAVTALTAGGR